MPILVMKFGGTSVANLERIEAAALKVKNEVDKGYQVAVVVSAMSGETNRFVDLVRGITSLYDAREYDTVVAAGEQVSSGLMALMLQKVGVPARSWQGWQIPVNTDNSHGAARIEGIDTTAMKTRLNEGLHAVVSGFQGIAPDNRISTLGRGGSDTSAVALAVALEAERCDIYTDVDGVYTTDPRIERNARKLYKIAYEEMLELASLGAKVLQTRSVELAMRYKMPLQVRSSFSDEPGTLVCDEEDIMEQNVVSGVAYSRNEAKITVRDVPDHPGVASAIFTPLSEAAINIDMIVQNVSEDSQTDMTFSLSMDDVERAKSILEKAQDTIKYRRLDIDTDVAKVSIVGIGMRSHTGIAQKMFSALAKENINIAVITTSEIKTSVLIQRKYMELAVQSLHSAFELDKMA
jgi:aspartate kinase